MLIEQQELSQAGSLDAITAKLLAVRTLWRDTVKATGTNVMVDVLAAKPELANPFNAAVAPSHTQLTILYELDTTKLFVSPNTSDGMLRVLALQTLTEVPPNGIYLVAGDINTTLVGGVRYDILIPTAVTYLRRLLAKAVSDPRTIQRKACKAVYLAFSAIKHLLKHYPFFNIATTVRADTLHSRLAAFNDRHPNRCTAWVDTIDGHSYTISMDSLLVLLRAMSTTPYYDAYVLAAAHDMIA